MKLGVTFLQWEIGIDPGRIRAFAEAAQALGFDYMQVYDHVLGADITNRPGWKGSNTSDDQFHEPFVLFGHLAAIAPRLEYVSGVIVLPQRQTALVAKQAAEVDLMTGGKFRLGVGVGWNEVEYEALNQSFQSRGRRIEEQITLLRRLWTEPVITFEGSSERVIEAGLNPLPIQRPIPVWIGGVSDAAIARAGRIADGWFPVGRADDAAARRIALLRASATTAGRDPLSLGIDARVEASSVPENEWAAELARWEELGATHASILTMGQGYSADEHIAAIARFAKAAGR